MADPFIGEVRMAGFGFAPQGWATCDGQLMPISQNQALFSLLGTTFGGNGINTFALPDLRGATPIHASPNHPVGQSGGEESHQLTVAELPTHNHVLGAVQADASSKIPVSKVPAYASEDAYSREGDSLQMDPGAVAPAGGGVPHTNMQPYLVVNFIIAMFGIFPSRN